VPSGTGLDISRLKIPTGFRSAIAARHAMLRQKDVFPRPGLAATTTTFWLCRPGYLIPCHSSPTAGLRTLLAGDFPDPPA
jgi:hypothetical protein